MANRYYQGLSEFHCYATRVTTNSMHLWVGTLERDMQKPAKARVRLCNGSGHQVDLKQIRTDDWKRPFPAASNDRFYKSFTFKELRPASTYRAYFERWRAKTKDWENSPLREYQHSANTAAPVQAAHQTFDHRPG